jgi:predicted kinase
VSLDALRRELNLRPTGDQRRVATAAYDRARAHLRSGRSFVWNATNVSRTQREACIGLAASYGARVEIVAVEAAPDTLRIRNATRPAPVPPAVLDRLVGKWEAPDLTEAHTVTWIG